MEQRRRAMRACAGSHSGRGRRRLALSAVALALALAAASPPATAYGPLPEDVTTAYPFGWSASRLTGEPIFLQYDGGTSDACQFPSHNPEKDAVDEPVRAFGFLNANGDYRVQLNKGAFRQNRRFIGGED